MENWLSSEVGEKVRNLVELRVGPLMQIIDPPTPLAGALQVATIEALAVNEASELDEEEMSATFIGAMAATIPWFASEFTDSFTPGFDWHKYSKNGRGETSEGSTGADFALMIRIDDKNARVAVFQAKPAFDEGSINIHRISPNRISENMLPQPQILRLAQHGFKALPKGATATDLTWVHYAIYDKANCFCISLSSIAVLLDEYAKFDESIRDDLQKRIDALVKEKPPALAEAAKAAARELWEPHKSREIKRLGDSVDLVHLLTIGAATHWGFNAPGWLPLEGKMAIDGFVKRAAGSLRLIEARLATPPTPENTPTIEGGAPQSPKGKIVASLNKAAESKDWTPSRTNSGKKLSM
ncbi:hypothetical protein MOU_20173 [Xanthomonas citri pv. malvacearum str. GSPB1386]|uniref:hypothetical protein n=1 Tax=Xanthomonas TaxID=338 RepID=UPI0002972C58|nr:hypothetical protein [Xanthomonas citri]AOL19846.1 hypothetical protein BGK55_12195 [Xanthomonas citri pv. malvacearum]ASY89121.1 hypothetical protein CIW72_12860 [Xanthomonas citri pv. malvacearum]EKQ59442.1 hypothetical protein MOU_20173 [Xanthomonas citri pv. malvacearum str. GSPB1386]